MAKLQDILELQKAGFNADEIAKLLPLVSEEKIEPAVTVKESAQVKTEEPKQVSKEEPKTEQVVDKLDELIKKVEMSSILNTQQPAQEKESLEEIMANIINPN